MTYRVQLAEQAETDLRGIFDYIAFELRSLQNAANQLDRLEKNIYRLDQMPERFRAYEKEPWRSQGLRVMPVDNYLVFYIPRHDTRVVQIIRVLYGRRDIDAQLEQTPLV